MRATNRFITLYCAGLYCVGALCSLAQAQVNTDGSLGARLTLPGPNYVIDASLGQQNGANLFHRFSAFNIGSGQSAEFKSSPTVSNIVARVTGSGASTINGVLVANANLFLINPQGLVFGANASLNVNGAFHASTADYLRLADGARFYANLGQSSVLSVAAPSAFGFLDTSVAPIVVQNAYLDVPATKSLALIG